jgi:hypothetical protein
MPSASHGPQHGILRFLGPGLGWRSEGDCVKQICPKPFAYSYLRLRPIIPKRSIMKRMWECGHPSSLMRASCWQAGGRGETQEKACQYVP